MNYSKYLYKIFQENEDQELIARLDTKFDFYKLDEEFIITTVTNEVKSNSYVVSPYTAMIDYSEDELVKIKSVIQKNFSLLLIKTFAFFLKYTQIDKAQTLNNYLFSTNFFSIKWESINVLKLEDKAIERYPEHGLIIRSVNKVQNPELFENLNQNGWMPIVSRQVYIFDDKKKWEKSRNTISDKKLLNSVRFIFFKVKENDSDAFLRAETLYNLLYLDKYSKHNIQFKAKYLYVLVQAKLLDLYLLKDTITSKYVGVVGITQEANVITVPIVGYDMSYTKKDALYRRLMIYAMSYAMERECMLNLSSGAPRFKSFRGASPTLEYMFVKVEHLSFGRRIVWRFISLLSKYFYVPLLKRLKL